MYMNNYFFHIFLYFKESHKPLETIKLWLELWKTRNEGQFVLPVLSDPVLDGEDLLLPGLGVQLHPITGGYRKLSSRGEGGKMRFPFHPEL